MRCDGNNHVNRCTHAQFVSTVGMQALSLVASHAAPYSHLATAWFGSRCHCHCEKRGSETPVTHDILRVLEHSLTAAVRTSCGSLLPLGWRLLAGGLSGRASPAESLWRRSSARCPLSTHLGVPRSSAVELLNRQAASRRRLKVGSRVESSS